MLRRIGQGVGLLAAAGVVALVVLYVARPAGSKHPPPAEANAAETLVAATRYAPVTPLPSITVMPSPPQPPAEIADVSTGSVAPLRLPPDYTVQAVFADDHVFAEKIDDGGIFDRSGSQLATLPALYGAELFSEDRRYMAYLAGGVLEVSDSDGHVTPTLPPGVRFGTEFGGGWLLLPGNGALSSGSGAAIIDPAGRALHTFGEGVRLGTDSIAPDGQRIAWAASNGLHVLSGANRSERVYAGVRYVVGDFGWSPDGTRLAYARLAGNSAQIWLIDLESGSEREVFGGASGDGIVDLEFGSAHKLWFRIRPADDRLGDEQSYQHYRIADDGSGLEAFDAPADRWHRCGPPCGMPPDGYEDASGLARWCVPAGDRPCAAPRTGYVDRGRGRVIALDPGENVYQIAVSPDRKTVAVLGGVVDGDEVRLVPVDGAATRTISLPGDFDTQVVWFSDSRSLLVYSQGRV